MHNLNSKYVPYINLNDILMNLSERISLCLEAQHIYI